MIEILAAITIMGIMILLPVIFYGIAIIGAIIKLIFKR